MPKIQLGPKQLLAFNVLNDPFVVEKTTSAAFGGHSPTKGDSLAERRRAIAQSLEIGPRTLFRYESRGVAEVIEHIDRILERPAPPEPQLTPDEKRSVDVVFDRSGLLMDEMRALQSVPPERQFSPDSLRRMRDAISAFLADVALYEYQDTAPASVRELITRYRDWYEDLDESYWLKRMKEED